MPLRTKALEDPTKGAYYLVEFRYGDTIRRYTNAHRDIDYLGVTFSSVPTISVDIPTSTGGVREDDFHVMLPRAGTFAREMASGVPFPPVRMIVRELVVARNDTIADVIHDGQCQVVVANPEGKDGMYRVSSQTIKSRLGVKMGIPATVTCQHVFGLSSDCGIDETAIQQNVTITRIQPGGLVVQVATITVSTPWTNGYLSLEGLRIKIRDYAGGTSLATTVAPPPSWQGRTVLATPGCRKTWDACGSDWANQTQFLGMGVAIPQYHPLLEGT